MFYFYSEGKKLRLPIKQIIYAEILNHDLYITTNGWGTVHSRMTLAAFLEKMPDNFIRIHHSYVINTDHCGSCGNAGGRHCHHCPGGRFRYRTQ